MEVQEAVYKLELGAGARWIRRGVLLIACLAIAFVVDLRQFRGFGSMEAMDAAQVARQIATGKGFTTQFIRPLALAQQRDHTFHTTPHATALEGDIPPEARDFTTIPDTYNPPLYPAVLAGLFKITRVDFEIPDISKLRIYAPEIVVLVFNEVCILLAAWLVFILAMAIFDERVAWVSLGIFLLGDLTWRFGISGTSIPFTLLLLLGSFYFFHRALFAEELAEEVPAWAVWLWVLLGALVLGLAILANYGAAWLLIPYIAVVASAFRARLLLTLAVIAVWLAVLLPWGIRNASITGDLLGGYSELVGENAGSYAGTSLSRTYRYLPDVLVWQEGFRKIVPGLRAQLDQGFNLLGSSLITVFFFAGLIHFFKRRRAQVLRYFALGSLIVLALGASLGKGGPLVADAAGNHLFLAWPLVVIFGTSFFFILLDRIEFPAGWVRTGALTFFLTLNALPLIASLMHGAALFSYPPYFPPVIVFASQWFEPNEVIASDIPWAVAWYGDRPSLWLPSTMKEYLEINDFVHPINAILLTPESRNAPALYEMDKGQWKDWSTLMHGHNIPPQIALSAATVLPPDKNDYLLVADHVRWPVNKPADSPAQ